MGPLQFRAETRLNIYTDGACSTNGTWESGAAIVVYVNDRLLHQKGKYLGKATNNIAELRAFEMALDYILAPIHFPENINIISDSAYIVNCFNQKWYEKWESNGWTTSQKKAVMNKEIWEDILRKYRKVIKLYKLEIIKTKGHSDDQFNNEVDRVAVYCKEHKEDYDK